MHETDDLAGEIYADTWACGGDDGPRLDLVGSYSGVDVGRRVSYYTHGEEDDEEIHPDGRIGQPSEILQGSDLSQDHTGEGPDDAEHDEASVEIGDLGQTLAVGDDDNSDVEEQLDGLEDIDAVAAYCSIDTECNISIGLERVLV